SFKGYGGPVAFSSDGKTLLATAGERGGTLRDLSTGKERVSLKGYGFSGGSTSIHVTGKTAVFSPDGKLIATGRGKYGSDGLPGDGEVTLWDVATGRERASLGRSVKLKITLRSLSNLKADGVPKRVLLKLVALDGKEFPTEE